MKNALLVLTFFLIVLNLTSGQFKGNLYLVNSNDWKDVYSASLYAALLGAEARFVQYGFNPSSFIEELPFDQFVLLESNKPAFPSIAALMRSSQRQVTDSMRFEAGTLNFQLAKKAFLEGKAKNLILTTSEFGYNAISVMPYSTFTNSYVLLIDSKNYKEAINLVKELKPVNVTVYGKLPGSSLKALLDSGVKFEKIDYGNKYSNNLEVVKRYLQNSKVSQVTLTGGNFIENSFASGPPILFIGVDRVPPVVVDFLKRNFGLIGVLIGGDVFLASESLRKSKLLSALLIKYGKVITKSGGVASEVFDLDKFYLPNYNVSITINNAQYSTTEKKLLVTYANVGEVQVYFEPAYTFIDKKGKQIRTITGNLTSIPAKTTQVESIQVDLLAELESQNLLEISAPYGEDEANLDYVLYSSIPLLTTAYSDESEIEINEVTYNFDSKKFEVQVSNTGPVQAFAQIRFSTFINEEEFAPLAKILAMPTKGKASAFFDFSNAISKEQLEGKTAIIRATYGTDRELLAKTKVVSRPIKVVTQFDYTQAVIAILLIAVIAMAFWIYASKK